MLLSENQLDELFRRKVCFLSMSGSEFSYFNMYCFKNYSCIDVIILIDQDGVKLLRPFIEFTLHELGCSFF